MASLATEQEALFLLNELHINYQLIEHPAIWTMDDPNSPAGLTEVKNLFLKEKKTEHYFLYLTTDKRVDFRKLAQQINLSQKKLQFAKEPELKSILHVISGMVTPLALMYDTEKKVQVLLSNELKKIEAIPIHPNTNTATVLITFQDLNLVLNRLGYVPQLIEPC
ncbi:prolyl-tRNA editing protein [Ligilactobacillus sp. WILCCON 0076]|uniref:Prolyl-tRNA editing protein n=1 Tax=Ligilactobacillus ubinensis TaxID=2876789 RepID=A0A9X2JL01_9LACO|nr:YbaK/EbsC family protein [Ligilactobacillus ubinensis]MCP0886125.1 prolyl-tRNA editing protein [Ligilactobacillus ubinensis]